MNITTRYLVVKLVWKTKLASIKWYMVFFSCNFIYCREGKSEVTGVTPHFPVSLFRPKTGLGAQGGASISWSLWSWFSAGWISTRNPSLQGSVSSSQGNTVFRSEHLLQDLPWASCLWPSPGAFECHRVAATAESCRKCCAWGDETAGCMKGFERELAGFVEIGHELLPFSWG